MNRPPPHGSSPPDGAPRTPPPGSPGSAVEQLAEFLELHGPYDEAAARAEASRCLQCPEAFCVAGCPLGNQIPEWLRLTAEGRFLDAAALAQQASSLPEICGGPCPTEDLCQSACVLEGRGEPVAIGAIAQFLHDYAFRHRTAEPPLPPNGLRVGILGAGPGVLACAEELVRLGYAVVIHDPGPASPPPCHPGAMARTLSPAALERRAEHLRQRGVHFRPDPGAPHPVTAQALRDAFDAVFLGFHPSPADDVRLAGLARTAEGLLRVDEQLMTSDPGVFAGGGLVRREGPIVQQVRDGRRAAAAIHQFLFPRRVDALAASETDHLAPG